VRAKLVLCAAVVVLAGCGGSSADNTPIEDKLRRLASMEAHVKIDTVNCIKDTKHAKQYRCTVKLKSGDCQSWVMSDDGTEAAYFNQAVGYDLEGKVCRPPPLASPPLRTGLLVRSAFGRPTTAAAVARARSLKIIPFAETRVSGISRRFYSHPTFTGWEEVGIVRSDGSGTHTKREPAKSVVEHAAKESLAFGGSAERKWSEIARKLNAAGIKTSAEQLAKRKARIVYR
jgi:hypothetical protein